MTVRQANARTVTLVDSNRLSREGVARLLSEQGYTIRNGYSDLVAILDDFAANDDHPDLCVIDSSALSNEIEFNLRKLRENLPNTRIVVFVGGDEPNAILDHLLVNADGCLLKDMSLEVMVDTLHLAARGEPIFPTRALTRLLPWTRKQAHQADSMSLEADLCDPDECNLSDRERDVLAYLANGYANKQIAAETGMSESTVKIHLRSIMQKLGASNRTQTAIWALKYGVAQTRRATG